MKMTHTLVKKRAIPQNRLTTVNVIWINNFFFSIIQISEVFKSYTAMLERIAHMMPGDVHRLMENEVLVSEQIFTLLV